MREFGEILGKYRILDLKPVRVKERPCRHVLVGFISVFS